jgi:ABC-type lipoprotein export system ATPase subunit
MTTIQEIEVLGGKDKTGLPEPVERVRLRMGDVLSIVGPTGSGKSTLIEDIELLADGSTPTGRRILVNGATPDPELRDDPACHPIALITQHTSFLCDLPVLEFLRVHAAIRARSCSDSDTAVQETLDFANKLTGEPIVPVARMTELSGGQSRALLIADAVVIGSAPIVLLDEIENAGIHRLKALELLRAYRKIYVFVTHDPTIALESDTRIVMARGAMAAIQATTPAERRLARRMRRIDDMQMDLRERLRRGDSLVQVPLLDGGPGAGWRRDERATGFAGTRAVSRGAHEAGVGVESRVPPRDQGGR